MQRIAERNRRAAVATLKKGGILALPTETVYGLAASLSQPKAIERLLEIKQRPVGSGKVLTLMLANPNEIPNYAEVTRENMNTARHYFPGELTMILPKNKSFKNYYYDNFSTIGIRIPDHKGLLKIIREAGPLLVTSANPRGERACESAGEVAARMPQIDAILDGEAGHDMPSTIINFCNEKPFVVRQGGLLIVHY